VLTVAATGKAMAEARNKAYQDILKVYLRAAIIAKISQLGRFI